MVTPSGFDVLIIGGSYAGLSAALALGRSLRNVLIIDSGKPCNRQTPYSHNFITHDGAVPAVIAAQAREQVLRYDTVRLHEGIAVDGVRTPDGFAVTTAAGETFTGKKLLFATGITDQMPAIPGFAECWGISVIHCPYCHGYEVHHQPTGILGNGELIFEFAKMIRNWTDQLTVFTNGASQLTPEQAALLASRQVNVVETDIASLQHENGRLQRLVFADGSVQPLTALYARAAFVQHCAIPEALGCALTEHGHLQVNAFNETSVPGVYAAGDNTTMMRSVAVAAAAGMSAGAFINKALIEEQF